MKKLENKFRGIGKGIATGVGLTLGLTGLLLTTEACTPAQQKVVAGDVIISEAKTPEQLAAGYILKTIGEMEHDLEFARAGKDEININVGETGRATKYSLPPNVGYSESENALYPKPGYVWMNSKKKGNYEVVREFRGGKARTRIPSDGFFSFNAWVDLDPDGEMSTREVLGLGKRAFNLDDEYMGIGFKPHYRGVFLLKRRVIFHSLTEQGDVIGKSIIEDMRTTEKHVMRAGKGEYSGIEFIDSMVKNGPGKYIITANIPAGGLAMTSEFYKMDIVLVE